MKNVNVYLRDNLAKVSEKRMLVAPNINEKKLNNAIKSFKYSGSPSNIVAIFDNTIFGSGKDGIIFTGEQLIYRESFSDAIYINFNSLKNIEHIQKDENGKDKENSISLTTQDDTLLMKNLLDCDHAVLVNILKTTISEFSDFKEEKQNIAIEEMTEAVKIAYVKCIINMTTDNDGIIDNKEFAEILLLMTRLNLDTDSRFELRSYMASTKDVISLEKLLNEIEINCPDGQIKSLHISLVKDLINIFFCTGGSSVENFEFLQNNRTLFMVTDEEIELAVMAIQTDQNILKENVTDEFIISALKGLSAKAAAVGAPLAAVYLSGSVIGLSAAGITSGLASLGLGGLLGLSGMVTGIGVAVLIGVGAYSGVRKLTGANELTQFRRRELMLNEVIKQTQSTISMLIQDINFITDKLNEVFIKFGAQDAQIKKLMRLMTQMTGAASILTEKSEFVQGSVTKLRCAQFLNEYKLRSLTKDPTKIELYDFIRSFYEERLFVEEKEGVSKEITKLAIKHGYTNRDIESLARAFEAIGYFNVTDVLKSTASDVADKTKNIISDFFS